MKQVRVYRLEVIYPEGSHEKGWRPACWSQDAAFLASLDRKQRKELKDRQFRWPRERMFLSSSSAYRRANLLGWYGASARVYGSAPVEWPNPDNWAADDDWEHGDTAAHWYPDMQYTVEQVIVSPHQVLREQALSQLAAYRGLESAAGASLWALL